MCVALHTKIFEAVEGEKVRWFRDGWLVVWLGKETSKPYRHNRQENKANPQK